MKEQYTKYIVIIKYIILSLASSLRQEDEDEQEAKEADLTKKKIKTKKMNKKERQTPP